MTSTQWVAPPPRRRADGSGLRVVITVGAVLTVLGTFAALFLGALLPLGFYGDQNIPDRFSHGFDPYFRDSMRAAVAIVVVLLATALALPRIRPRRWARAVAVTCLVAAAATPWAWLVLNYLNGKHFSQLYPY